ncbi:MAG: hypothetical protein K0S07_257 [Chlamydiales bacterium]|jgi:hypothetical protein|nr:hypothetical protein [Chlamydiales bacterium]
MESNPFLPSALPQIIKTKTLDPILKEIEQAELDTLVLFDINEVLITPKDQIYHPAHQSFLSRLRKKLAKRLSFKERLKLWSILCQTRKIELVSEKILEVMALLEQRGMRAFALTNSMTGQIGLIERYEDWQNSALKRLGIDFQRLNPIIECYSFPEIPTKHGKPLFKEGIIFSDSVDKGRVLEVFLEKAKLHPKRLIFVDDKLKNIESVQDCCTKRKIAFTGFQYTEAREKMTEPLHQRRAELQFTVLEREKRWLSDEEATERLTHGSKGICPLKPSS